MIVTVIVSPVVPYMFGFRTLSHFDWLPHTATVEERQNRGLRSLVVVLVAHARTHGGSEKSEWGNAPILAAGPDLVRLQLHNRTQSEQHQMALVNSLDVNWKSSHCALQRRAVQQKRGYVPRTPCSSWSIVPPVQFNVDTQFGQR